MFKCLSCLRSFPILTRATTIADSWLGSLESVKTVAFAKQDETKIFLDSIG